MKNIKIEIIQFYPIVQQKKTIGTLRILLPEIGLNLLGITVVKTKTGLCFYLPMGRGYNYEAKKWVQYPLYSMNDITNDQIVKELRKIFPAFYENWLKTNKLPTVAAPPYENRQLVKKRERAAFRALQKRQQAKREIIHEIDKKTPQKPENRPSDANQQVIEQPVSPEKPKARTKSKFQK